MARFKRVNDQYAIQIDAYETLGNDLHVGDVLSYNPNTKEAVKLTTLAGAITAESNGLQIIVISQGDQVTNKEGTAYKTYTVSSLVDMSNAKEAAKSKIIVGYVVKDLTNLQF